MTSSSASSSIPTSVSSSIPLSPPDAHFTLVSSAGDEYRLPLVDAEHCTALAWLIPSRTLSCILPPECTAASIRLVLRLLHLLSHHTFPSYYDSDQQQAEQTVPAVFLDAVSGLGKAEKRDCVYTCTVLRVHPLNLARLWEARDAVLKQEARAAGTEITDEQVTETTLQGRHGPLLDISLPAHASVTESVPAVMPEDDNALVFTVTTKEGLTRTVPASLASLVPAARARMAIGSSDLTLLKCTNATLTVVLDFLRLLTSTPLLVSHGAFTAGGPSKLTAAVYSTFFDQHLSWQDKSIVEASLELRLDTLLQAAMVKTAEMLTTMMQTEAGRQALMTWHAAGPSIQVRAVAAQ